MPAPKPTSWLERLWSSIAERGQSGAGPDLAVPPLDRARLLAEALLSERGEASGAAVARELHAALRDMAPDDRLAFARFLAAGFMPNAAKLRAAAEAYLADPTPELAARLSDAADPPRQELLRRMNLSPGGTASLVAMRQELLAWLRDNPELKPLDADLRHLLASWFNRGFLELKRIDWQTPAATLEKLIAYEAVHEIQGWDDLRRRVGPDRRCFGFFHPALPSEPLIFVEVALVEGLAASVQPLLAADAEDDPAHSRARAREAAADTAIFYSISNCQEGLRGVSFGNFLIKQVVEELKAELPRLTRFSTLSPVPGFRRWLEKRLAEPETLYPDERDALLQAAPEEGDPNATLQTLLRMDNWWETAAIAKALRKPLSRLCAVYLTGAPGKGSPDPVARFHLGNGARLERINWLGNTAPRGMRESCGIMVNYLYDLPTIEANHEAYVRDGLVVRSPAVETLMTLPPEPVRSSRLPSRLARMRGG